MRSLPFALAVILLLPGCLTASPVSTSPLHRMDAAGKALDAQEDADLLAELLEARGGPPPLDEEGNPIAPVQLTPWSEAVGLQEVTRVRKAEGVGNVAGLYPIPAADRSTRLILGVRDAHHTTFHVTDDSGPLRDRGDISPEWSEDSWWATTIPRTGSSLVVLYAHTDRKGILDPEPGGEKCTDSRNSPSVGEVLKGWAAEYSGTEKPKKERDPRFWDCLRVKGYVLRWDNTAESATVYPRVLSTFVWSPGWMEILPLRIAGRDYLFSHKPDGTVAVDRVVETRSGRTDAVHFVETYRALWSHTFNRFLPYTIWNEQFILAYSTITGEYAMVHASPVHGNPDHIHFTVANAGWWNRGWTSWVPMGETKDGFVYWAYNRETKTAVVDQIGLDHRVTTLARERWDPRGVDLDTIVALPSTPTRASLAVGGSGGLVHLVEFTARPDSRRYLPEVGISVQFSSEGELLEAAGDTLQRGGEGPTTYFNLERPKGSTATGPPRYNEPLYLRTNTGHYVVAESGRVLIHNHEGGPGSQPDTPNALWRLRQSGDPNGNDPILRRFATTLDPDRGAELFVNSDGSVDTRQRWIWQRSSGSSTLHLL